MLPKAAALSVALRVRLFTAGTSHFSLLLKHAKKKKKVKVLSVIDVHKFALDVC